MQTTHDKLIRARAPKKLLENIKRLAKRRGCASSDIIREAVMTFVASEETRLAAK